MYNDKLPQEPIIYVTHSSTGTLYTVRHGDRKLLVTEDLEAAKRAVDRVLDDNSLTKEA